MSTGRKLVVVGQGYVGLPLAMRAVEVGYDVVGFDLDLDRVKGLANGVSFTPDVDNDVVADALVSGRYQATDDVGAIEGFDIAVITVPTPLRDGGPDLSFVESAAATLGGYLRPGAMVVLESTTYPGTTEELMIPILELHSGLTAGRDFHVGYSPERIDPGSATWGLVNTPKVVSGIDDASRHAIEEFYSSVVDHVVPVASTRVAELAKLLENTFRHVNIALVNELAVFANDLGIDVWAAIDAAATKPFGFMRFTPGPGVGGHCLPIDPTYLAWAVRRDAGRPFRFVELANDVNEHMPHYVVHRAGTALNRHGLALSRSRILLLGLAYKRDTSDARESPACTVAELLVATGADVRVADPLVGAHRGDSIFTRVEATPDEVAAADLVVLLTDHSAFDLEMITVHATQVLDTRHRMKGDHVETL
jgi:UDP-N-acetyl-D-glucosamine dehydrogenase